MGYELWSSENLDDPLLVTASVASADQQLSLHCETMIGGRALVLLDKTKRPVQVRAACGYQTALMILLAAAPGVVTSRLQGEYLDGE